MQQTVLRITGLLFVTAIFAHPSIAQTKVGVRAGMNPSGVNLVDERGDKQKTGMIPRFQAGLTVDIPITADFFACNRLPCTRGKGSGRMAVGWPRQTPSSIILLLVGRDKSTQSQDIEKAKDIWKKLSKNEQG